MKFNKRMSLLFSWLAKRASGRVHNRACGKCWLTIGSTLPKRLKRTYEAEGVFDDSLLRNDLFVLSQREWIAYSMNTGESEQACANRKVGRWDTWIVSLTTKGLDHYLETTKPFWQRMYEKEPVQMVVGVVNMALYCSKEMPNSTRKRYRFGDRGCLNVERVLIALVFSGFLFFQLFAWARSSSFLAKYLFRERAFTHSLQLLARPST